MDETQVGTCEEEDRSQTETFGPGGDMDERPRRRRSGSDTDSYGEEEYSHTVQAPGHSDRLVHPFSLRILDVLVCPMSASRIQNMDGRGDADKHRDPQQYSASPAVMPPECKTQQVQMRTFRELRGVYEQAGNPSAARRCSAIWSTEPVDCRMFGTAGTHSSTEYPWSKGMVPALRHFQEGHTPATEAQGGVKAQRKPVYLPHRGPRLLILSSERSWGTTR